MKSIEERAKHAWNEYEYGDGDLYSNCFCDGYEQGATDEHKLLTEWHEVDENTIKYAYPQMLVKLKYVGNDGKERSDLPFIYEVATVIPNTIWENWELDYPNKLNPNYRLVGWRKIHE